jgi:phage terminase large subunit-like protein
MLSITAIQGEIQRRWQESGRVYLAFPDDGPHARHLYKKQLAFFKLGATHSERVFLAANRVGKTFCAAYEITCHAMGWYPHWWAGWRVARPVSIIAAGDTGATTRDIIQAELLGPDVDKCGTGGMIPRDVIKLPCYRKAGIPRAIDDIRVHSSFGGLSLIKLRSYDQGRKIYQGTAEDIVWVDEEAPQDVVDEAKVRLMTTEGRLISTYTAVDGYTDYTTDILDNNDVLV